MLKCSSNIMHVIVWYWKPIDLPLYTRHWTRAFFYIDRVTNDLLFNDLESYTLGGTCEASFLLIESAVAVIVIVCSWWWARDLQHACLFLLHDSEMVMLDHDKDGYVFIELHAHVDGNMYYSVLSLCQLSRYRIPPWQRVVYIGSSRKHKEEKGKTRCI